MKIVNICLARKESKRLPGKNMKLFCDKPLIDYTARIMQRLGYDSYIYTDWLKICNYVNIKYPEINVRPKPAKYAQDIHLTNEELKHYNKDINADIFIYLPATSPVREYSILVEGINEFLNNLDKYDCAMSVKKMPDRMYWKHSGESLNIAIGDNFNIFHRNFNNNKTFKNDIYQETGSFYIFKKELLDNNFFINEKCLFIEQDYVIDLDTEDDWNEAENFMQWHNLII